MSVSSPLQADLRFLTDVAEELDRARKSSPNLQSIFVGYPEMRCLLEQLWVPDLTPEGVRQALVRIAVMAARTAVDVLDD